MSDKNRSCAAACREASASKRAAGLPIVEYRPTPPVSVLMERDRAFSFDRRIGSELLGEPLPGRSAWDRRRV